MNEPSEQEARVAVVTGGSSGIGEAISKRLARRGFTVVIAARRTEENERVASEINSADSGRAIARQTDVSREEDCLGLIRETLDSLGRIDLLVNNAGMGGMGPIVDSTSEEFDRVMKTNLYSAYWCSREAFRAMLHQDRADETELRGRIINVASVCGVDAWAGTSMYAASKHGMMGLTRALSDEGSEEGIRVAAICPAMVATPMTEVAGPDYISPEDIAATVDYLLGLSTAAWPTEIVIPRRGSA